MDIKSWKRFLLFLNSCRGFWPGGALVVWRDFRVRQEQVSSPELLPSPKCVHLDTAQRRGGSDVNSTGTSDIRSPRREGVSYVKGGDYVAFVVLVGVNVERGWLRHLSAQIHERFESQNTNLSLAKMSLVFRLRKPRRTELTDAGQCARAGLRGPAVSPGSFCSLLMELSLAPLCPEHLSPQFLSSSAASSSGVA